MKKKKHARLSSEQVMVKVVQCDYFGEQAEESEQVGLAVVVFFSGSGGGGEEGLLYAGGDGVARLEVSE